jgi:hypothetical protein
MLNYGLGGLLYQWIFNRFINTRSATGSYNCLDGFPLRCRSNCTNRMRPLPSLVGRNAAIVVLGSFARVIFLQRQFQKTPMAQRQLCRGNRSNGLAI